MPQSMLDAAPSPDKSSPRASARAFAGLLIAAVFLCAQFLFAGHGVAGDDVSDHRKSACEACLAGAAIDDPSVAGDINVAPILISVSIETAIPAALLTEIAVKSTSSRGPPLH